MKDIAQKEVKKESTVAYSSELDILVNRMVNTKNAIFGRILEIFDLYMKDTVFTRKIPKEFADNPASDVLRFKSDTTASSIEHTAISTFISALLPNGIQSVSVRYPYLHTHANAQNSELFINELAKLEKTNTEQTQLYLKKTNMRVADTLTHLGLDFLNYGTAAAFLNSKGALERIPFRDLYLESKAGDEEQIMMYKEHFFPLIFVTKYPEWARILGITTLDIRDVVISHLYLPENMAEHVLLKKHPKQELETLPMNQDSKANPFYIEVVFETTQRRILDVRYHVITARHPYPFFLARTADIDEVWSIGSGLQALSSIVHLNYYTNAQTASVDLAFRPATAMPKSSTAQVAGESHESNDAGNVSISFMPGSLTLYDMYAGTAASPEKNPPFAVLINPAEHFALFQAAQADCAKKIEIAYNTFLLSAAEHVQRQQQRTATEIVEQIRAGIRQFKGTSLPFYDGLLIPWLEIVAMGIIIHPSTLVLTASQIIFFKGDPAQGIIGQVPNFDPLQDFEIDIFSFEDQQEQQIKGVKIQTWIQAKQALGVPLTKEELEETNKILREAYII